MNRTKETLCSETKPQTQRLNNIIRHEKYHINSAQSKLLIAALCSLPGLTARLAGNKVTVGCSSSREIGAGVVRGSGLLSWDSHGVAAEISITSIGSIRVANGGRCREGERWLKIWETVEMSCD
ncbi:GntR family transcriptional regulator [Striga asiatica]|uniref:GntR family transcriptional regulator n=1 Tax=Striga asiatica TaxID=4170 RepID=A0A5A7QSI4_STRAF|nr:GntR family transcriptional regulator [Striga asiatica]